MAAPLRSKQGLGLKDAAGVALHLGCASRFLLLKDFLPFFFRFCCVCFVLVFVYNCSPLRLVAAPAPH